VPAGKPHGGQWTKPGDHGGGATVDGTGNGPADGDGEGRTSDGEASDEYYVPSDDGSATDADAEAEEQSPEDDPNYVPVAGGNRPPPPRRGPPPPGHNNPPAEPSGRPPSRTGTGAPPFTGPEASNIYRSMHGYPDAGTHRYDGTVAWADMDGQGYLGIASTMPGYTQEDRDAANAMRDRLVQSDPDTMATGNIGHKPNDALYHAETTALTRAARANGGSLSGKEIGIYVDRPMCPSCDKVLPLVSRELGHPTVNFTDIYGQRHLLRSGRWE
jgi:hypothetical protein